MLSKSNASKAKCKVSKNVVKNNGRCNPAPATKPLAKYIFFLDINNHSVSSRIEAKIKQLGGKSELFLERHVTHVISERCDSKANDDKRRANGFDLNCTTPSFNDSNSSFVESPFTPDVCSTKSAKKKIRNRSEAMLEKVVNHHQKKFDVLDKAKNWGIPILSVKKILQIIEEIAAKAPAPESTSHANYYSDQKLLVAPYIKIETLANDRRPVHRQLSVWPKINLYSGPGESPFELRVKRASTKNAPQMVRKRTALRSSMKADKLSVLKTGYCEICKLDYDNLTEHIETETHLIFTRNDEHFLSLDKLIKNEANVEHFLNITRNESTYLATPRRSLRTSANGINGVELKLISCNNFQGKTMRDKKNGECSKQSDKNVIQAHSELSEEENKPKLKSKTNGIQTRSANKSDAKKPDKNGTAHDSDSSVEDEQPLIKHVQNKILTGRSFYRVEVLSKNEPLEPIEPKIEPIESNEPNDRVVVKFKRIRPSELSILNNEAENFMFPKRDDPGHSNSHDSPGNTDIGPLNSTCTSDHLDQSIDLRSSSPRKRCDAIEERNTNSVCSIDSVGSVKSIKSATSVKSVASFNSETSQKNKIKKRRTQAEAFIDDNEKYYKFESPSTRLRLHGSFFPIISNRNEPIPTNQFTINNFKYPFETFKVNSKLEVLDQIKRNFECFKSYYCTPDLYPLPYQSKMNAKPAPLDPKICVKTFTAACHDVADRFCDEIEARIASSQDDKTSERESDDGPEKVLPMKNIIRKKLLLSPKSSRKSPRKHASTLAILSLLHKRRNKSSNNSPNTSPTRVTQVRKMNPAKIDPALIDDYFNNCNASDLITMFDESAFPSVDAPVLETRTCVDEILGGAREFHFNDDVLVNNTVDVVKVIKDPRKVLSCKLNGSGKRRSKLNRTGWPKVKKRRVNASDAGSSCSKNVPKTGEYRRKKKFTYENTNLPKKKILVTKRKRNATPNGTADNRAKYLIGKPRASARQKALYVKYAMTDSARRRRVVPGPSPTIMTTRKSRSPEKKSSCATITTTDLQPLVRLQKLDELNKSPYCTRKRKLASMAESPIDDDFPRPYKRHKRGLKRKRRQTKR